jgi:hypothetical protein
MARTTTYRIAVVSCLVDNDCIRLLSWQAVTLFGGFSGTTKLLDCRVDELENFDNGHDGNSQPQTQHATELSSQVVQRHRLLVYHQIRDIAFEDDVQLEEVSGNQIQIS